MWCDVRMFRSGLPAVGIALALAVGSGLMSAPSAVAAPGIAGLDGPAHGTSRVGPSSARTVSAAPTNGPDFELPFVCGQAWTGATRAAHSPSPLTADFNAPDDLGKPAVASAPGVVTLTRSLTTSYGRYVIVDHGNGYTTLYAHLNSIAVTVGQVVDQGDVLGYVGSSGGSTGPHLHFEERRDGGYFNMWFTRNPFVFGAPRVSANCGDRPLAGDFDGDGTDEPAVWRPAASGGRFYLRTQPKTQSLPWGKPGDTPLAGDFNGDGITQVGTKQLGMSTWQLRGGSGATATVSVGGANDEPLTGDWDGNGLAELGWYRWSDRSFTLRAADYSTRRVVWGLPGEQPVVGDWNGDRVSDIGAFKPATATWRLRVPSGSTYATHTVVFGSPGDRPVTGDWNGDGTVDLGVWRPSTATFHLRVPQGTGFVTQTVAYGTPRG